MIKVAHRINDINLLRETPVEFGIEVDIRTFGRDLIIHHEPYERGELFEIWLEEYNHKLLILHVKEEGLEQKILKLLEIKNIDNFFFLDQSFPFLIKTINSGEKRCSIRVSEYERIETAMSLKNKVDWIWLDCFDRFPITEEELFSLKNEGGFKICIVSPELQGRSSTEEILNYKETLNSMNFVGDAVCTKYPTLWT